MKTLRYLQNPNRDSIVLKQFHFGNFYFDTLACILGKGPVTFNVEDTFGGAVVEYFSSVNKGEHGEFVTQGAMVYLTGFNHYFLVRNLAHPFLVKSDRLSHVEYSVCTTRWDFVNAAASRLHTMIPVSAIPDGLTELPTYSIGAVARCAILTRNNQIIDFHYGVGHPVGTVFGISRKGRSITRKVNADDVPVIVPVQSCPPPEEVISEGVPADDSPPLHLASSYVSG